MALQDDIDDVTNAYLNAAPDVDADVNERKLNELSEKYELLLAAHLALAVVVAEIEELLEQ
jgi:hypothetical protein